MIRCSSTKRIDSPSSCDDAQDDGAGEPRRTICQSRWSHGRQRLFFRAEDIDVLGETNHAENLFKMRRQAVHSERYAFMRRTRDNPNQNGNPAAVNIAHIRKIKDDFLQAFADRRGD